MGLRKAAHAKTLVIMKISACVCCFYLFAFLMLCGFFSPFIGVKVSYLGSVQPWLVIPLITRWPFTDSGACLFASDWSLRWLALVTSRARSALWFRACVQKYSTSLAFTITTTPLERDATRTFHWREFWRRHVSDLTRRGKTSIICSCKQNCD